MQLGLEKLSYKVIMYSKPLNEHFNKQKFHMVMCNLNFISSGFYG